MVKEEGPLADKIDRTKDADRNIRVVLADSSRLTTMGISQVLQKEADLELVGTAADGEEAIAKTLELEPDVLVIEADLPRTSGIKVTQRVRRELPHVGVVVLTAKDEEQTLFEAIRAGAAAYLNKDCDPVELVVGEVGEQRELAQRFGVHGADPSCWQPKRATAFRCVSRAALPALRLRAGDRRGSGRAGRGGAAHTSAKAGGVVGLWEKEGLSVYSGMRNPSGGMAIVMQAIGGLRALAMSVDRRRFE